MKQYEIRDISLAPSGHQKIQWVKNNMPLLAGLEEEFRQTKPFEGIKVSLSVHLEAKLLTCVWYWQPAEQTCP